MVELVGVGLSEAELGVGGSRMADKGRWRCPKLVQPSGAELQRNSKHIQRSEVVRSTGAPWGADAISVRYEGVLVERRTGRIASRRSTCTRPTVVSIENVI